MYESGTIDEISVDLSNSNEATNEKESERESSQSTGCQRCLLKTFHFLTRSPTLHTWNGIKFKVNGFLVGMVIFDVVFEIISKTSFVAGLHALLRNLLLFILIFVCCVMRIKIFGTPKTSAGALPDINDARPSTIDEKPSDSDQIGDDDESIQFKSVIFTYLGGLISLKSMTSVISKQCQYFSFAILFHAVFAFGFWIWSASLGGREALSWLRSANFYCMLLCLLPVPGFDGAALSTIFLKEKMKWGKVAITTFLLIVSCIITVTCGIIAVFMRTIIAFYLAFYCGLRVLQYAFNPKDENMKVLKAMAKVSKKMTATEDL